MQAKAIVTTAAGNPVCRINFTSPGRQIGESPALVELWAVQDSGCMAWQSERMTETEAAGLMFEYVRKGHFLHMHPLDQQTDLLTRPFAARRT